MDNICHFVLFSMLSAGPLRRFTPSGTNLLKPKDVFLYHSNRKIHVDNPGMCVCVCVRVCVCVCVFVHIYICTHFSVKAFSCFPPEIIIIKFDF